MKDDSRKDRYMLRDRLGKELLYFDGGMGTLLQERGLAPGELPETWNVEHPEVIREIHRRYIEAGSDIVLTNTFGANALKFHDERRSLKEIVEAAVGHVKEAVREAGAGREIYTALDVGPTGKLLKPMGDLDFETAYEAFREVMVIGEQAGADLIHIETMSDTYELKAAVLAAKENTSLPVFATAIFDERRKLLTGADVSSVVALLEGLRVDALGINCGMGPEQMLPVLEEMLRYSSLPVIVKPNAGLPQQRDGKTCYDVMPEKFAGLMRQITEMGASVIGGCCGTTPEHIRAMREACRGGERILIPRAKIGNHGILEELEQKPDLQISDIATYDTLYENQGIIDEKKEFEQGKIHCAVFTSASTVKGFVKACPDLDYSKVTAACIGKQTKAAADAWGMKTYMAEKATIDSVLELVQRLENNDMK